MFQSEVRINPRVADALDGAGEALLRKGEPEQSLPYFLRALKIEPDSAKVHFQLGQAYEKTGQHQKAKNEIAEAARLQTHARRSFEDTMAGKLRTPPAEP